MVRGEIDLGLSRVKTVLEFLSRPEKSIAKRVVHVTGTNGKGSTVEMIATGLQHLGVKVGVFTSPFLIEERDSIRVLLPGTLIKHNIPADSWESIRKTITDLISANSISITDFELLFLTVLQYFESQELDVAVIEVGMGGRDDATNVFDAMAPLCVLTGVSLDHQQFLGTTVEDICDNKCGIFKRDSPVVFNAEIPSSCIKIVETTCEKVGVARTEPIQLNSIDSLNPPINGGHQKLLMKIAMEVIKIICPGLSEEAVINAISHTRLPGRLEWRNDASVGFPLLLDGAHNTESVAALRQFVNHYCETHNVASVLWIIATSKGREEIVPLMLSEWDEVIFTRFKSFQEDSAPWIQSADPATLVSKADCLSNNISIANDISKALEMARKRILPNTIVIVAGSLYLVRNYLRILNNDDINNY